MKKMLAFVAAATFVSSASLGAGHETAGGGGAFSAPSTWMTGGVPAEGEADLSITLAATAEGRAYVNDLPFVPLLSELSFRGNAALPGARHALLSGGAMRIAMRGTHSGGIGISTDVPEGFAGEVSAPLVAAFPNTHVKVPAGCRLVLSGPLSHEPVDPQHYPAGVTDALWTTNSFRFNGAGTNVIRGVYHVDAAVYYITGHAAPQFENGTTIVENEMYLPRFLINSGTFVVAPGGKVSNWKSVALVGDATVDVAGGLWRAQNSVYWANGAANVSRVRVRDGGAWMLGEKEVLGYAGLTEVSVEDGGFMDLRGAYYQGFSNSGSTHLTVSGGVVREAVDAVYLGSFRNAAADNWLSLEGGEVWAGRLSQHAKKGVPGKDVDVRLFASGGTLVATLTGKPNVASTLDPFIEGDASKFHTYARAGGLVVDTMLNEVNYNAAIAGNDDPSKADGGVTKLGAGVLRLSVPCTYTGTNDVRCGTLELAAANAAALTKVSMGATLRIGDPAHYSRAVRLASGGRLSFNGAALSLEALSAAADGRLVLSPGAQTVAIGSAPELEGTLGVELAGTVANGTYPLVSAAAAGQVASACRVANPAVGKAYSFAAANGLVSVTVADAAALSAWNAPAGGAWTEPGNWTGGAPTSAGAQATFGVSAAVDVDADVTVGSLLIDGAESLALGGAGTLTLANGGAAALVEARTGSHAISAGLTLQGGAVLKASAGAALTLSGEIRAAPGAAALLEIRGAGTVSVAGDCHVPILVADTATLCMAEGARIMAGVTVAAGAALRIDGTAELAGTLNAPNGTFSAGSPDAALVRESAPERLSLHYSSSGPSPTMAFRNLDALRRADLRYSTLGYAGAEAGTLSADIILNGVSPEYTPTIRRLPGSGDLTFSGSVVANVKSGLQVQGDLDGEIALAGDWVATAESCFRLGGGRIRLSGGYSLQNIWDLGHSLRVGGASGEETVVTMDDGARISAYDLTLTPKAGAAGADVSFTQKGGAVTLRDGLTVGWLASSSPKSYRLEDGTFMAGPASWTRFLYGPSSLTVVGGEMSLGSMVFGEVGNGTSDYEVKQNPIASGSTRIDVSGGALTVSGDLDLSGDACGHRYNRLTAGVGGTVSLPAAIRTAPGDGLANGGAYTALVLDGGTLNLTGRGAGEASSLSDYFPSLGALALGTNGGTVDTRGNDVTIRSPLLASAEGGTFVKKGAGALTLEGRSVVRGGVDVRQGSLTVDLSAERLRAPGDGLVAYWDFDGDDPLADRSGHGYDLKQMNASSFVEFTETDAFDGRSAYWDRTRTWAWLGAFTNADEKVIANEFTVTLFARFDGWDKLYSSDKASTVFATKIQPQKEKGMKSNADSLVVTAPNVFASDFGSQTVLANVDVSSVLELRRWHLLTYVRKAGEISLYVDGVLIQRNSTPKPELGLLDFLNAEDGADTCRMLSFGRGTHSQNCAVKNMMIDDIAVYRRALTEAEIARYRSERSAAATPAIAVADGATLDLRGGAVSAPALSGGGTVEGGVTVLGRLVADGDGPIHVRDLAFGEGGTVDLAFAEGERARGGYSRVVATFETLGADAEAALRTWAVTGFGRDGESRWRGRLGVDRAAKAVTATIDGPGLVFVIR